MRRTVQHRSAAGEQGAAYHWGLPDECPRCHSKVVPIPLGAAVRLGDSKKIEEAFQCANHKCAKIFIAIYRPGSMQGEDAAMFYLVKSFPLEPHPPAVSEHVAEVSPAFVETYGQAIASESYSLTQLTGIGLRKALEFLVKDFSINQHPEEKEKIQKKRLASCINDYLNDPYLKATAKRATWLGNDETHYIRKWEDKDINDLKLLIRLTINWIDNVLLTQKYMSEMPDAKSNA